MEELRSRLEAYEQQAAHDAMERGALRQQVASHEKLAARRKEDEDEARLSRLAAAAVLRQREDQIRAVKEELVLERDLVVALRDQVSAMETVRETDARELRELQQRRAGAGSSTGSPAGYKQLPATMGDLDGEDPSWEAILADRVRAMEGARAGARGELTAMEQQRDAARRQVEAAFAQGPMEQIRAEATAVQARMAEQLDAYRERLEATRAEADACSATAERLRQRLAEQEHWLGRRDAQLGSSRREVGALQRLLEQSNAQLIAAEAKLPTGLGAKAAAAGAGGGGGDGEGCGATGATAAGLEAISAAASEGRLASLGEQIEELQRAQQRAAADAAAALAEERSALLRSDGKLEATQAALTQEQARHADAQRELREAKGARTQLQVESRARALEVTRLAQEVGALQARLQAASQEAISADDQASNLRLQRQHDARELQRLGEGEGAVASLLSQLRGALASESARVAKAWEERERLRVAVGERDEQLRALQTETFHLRADVASQHEQIAQLHEQRRLSEILLEGAEERHKLTKRAVHEARDEAAQSAMQLASASAQLQSLRETALKSKEEALQRAGEQVFGLQVANDGRQTRIEMLRHELAQRAEEVLRLKGELARRVEAERALREGELEARKVEAEQAQAQARLLQLGKADAEEAGARHERRVERLSQELTARAEQLRIAHEAHQLTKLEAALRDERVRSLTDTLETERTRAQRENAVLRLLQQQQLETAATATKLLGEATAEREKVAVLELRLAERDEHAAVVLEELRAAELRGEGREARLALLRGKMSTRGEEVRLRDERLGLLHARLQLATEQHQAKSDEARAVLAELAEAQAAAQTERAAADGARRAASRAAAQVRARDEQLATMERRLHVARDSVQVQLTMLEEELTSAQLKIDSKDLELDLVLEESTAREEQTQQFMGLVTARLRKAHGVMGAKDALLAELGRKLKQAVDTMSVQAAKGDAAREAAQRADAAREQREHELDGLRERHDLVASDLATATEALDNYRESLVQAEVRAEHDRQRVGELHSQLRQLQSQMAADGGTPRTQASSAAGALPPLQSAATGAEVAGSRVHYLYFLSSFLLLKTALAKEGQMANAPAQEVYDEIVANDVPLDEWPTYIFTRVFAAAGSADAHERQMLALKAAAKHAKDTEDARATAAGAGADAAAVPTGA
mgnify:CR=1 FL=1